MDSSHRSTSTRSRRPGRGSTGWQRVAGLAVVGAAGTVTAVLTGSTDAVIGVVLPLLPYLPR